MHSQLSRVEEIIALLKEGKNLALVSDAGTPGISDPGAELVARVRKAFNMDIGVAQEEHLSQSTYESDKKVATLDEVVKIESVPGPSALTTALSIAGVPCADFTFLGFLPHKKGRETLFREIASSERTMVFYESSHRILKALDSLVEHLNGDQSGAPKDKKIADKKVTVCRELTKVFEEVVSGTPTEARDYFQSHPDKVRGEFVVIVSRV
jgi:16S rRNA (cytidine1402-2'-O)-methyltransferase